MTEAAGPTPYPEINALLDELLRGARGVLGDRFVGMYLEGSLANGGFDEASDIDFVVVTDEEVSPELFAQLRAMHDRIATLDTPWAIQLEGSYVGREALRRYDPANAVFPNIERGTGERLKMAHFDASWVIHLWILRELGIVLAGPPPRGLVDPVSPGDLRRAMLSLLPERGRAILQNPELIAGRGYQSYIVLSLCRMLYTLQYGEVVSKQAAAQWALQALDKRRRPLIERALVGRFHAEEPAPAGDVEGTLGFIRYALESVKRETKTEPPRHQEHQGRHGED